MTDLQLTVRYWRILVEMSDYFAERTVSFWYSPDEREARISWTHQADPASPTVYAIHLLVKAVDDENMLIYTVNGESSAYSIDDWNTVRIQIEDAQAVPPRRRGSEPDLLE